MTNRLLLTLLFSVSCPMAWPQDPVGTEFRVNSFTVGNQYRPVVASAANGNFVVVWQSFAQDGSDQGIFGQRFSASGAPQGGEFQVNSYTTGAQYRPAVASAANGNFVVVWQSVGQDGDLTGVFGQRFDASGVPQGSEFQVNSYTTGPQGGDEEGPAVASAANGNFVVVWQSLGPDGSLYGVFGQRFDAAGLRQGSEFQVNSYTTASQEEPAVAADSTGSFVVAWGSGGQDGSNSGVFGQRFDASGVPQGSEFQVNSYTTGYQSSPTVASDPNGNFVIAWNGQDGSNYGVFGQRFNAVGLPQGTEFQINSYTTSLQVGPAVASAANGNFVVAWSSAGQDGSNLGAFGQRYGDLIFRDGFE